MRLTRSLTILETLKKKPYQELIQENMEGFFLKFMDDTESSFKSCCETIDNQYKNSAEKDVALALAPIKIKEILVIFADQTAKLVELFSKDSQSELQKYNIIAQEIKNFCIKNFEENPELKTIPNKIKNLDALLDSFPGEEKCPVIRSHIPSDFIFVTLFKSTLVHIHQYLYKLTQAGESSIDKKRTVSNTLSNIGRNLTLNALGISAIFAKNDTRIETLDKRIVQEKLLEYSYQKDKLEKEIEDQQKLYTNLQKQPQNFEEHEQAYHALVQQSKLQISFAALLNKKNQYETQLKKPITDFGKIREKIAEEDLALKNLIVEKAKTLSPKIPNQILDIRTKIASQEKVLQNFSQNTLQDYKGVSDQVKNMQESLQLQERLITLLNLQNTLEKNLESLVMTKYTPDVARHGNSKLQLQLSSTLSETTIKQQQTRSNEVLEISKKNLTLENKIETQSKLMKVLELKQTQNQNKDPNNSATGKMPLQMTKSLKKLNLNLGTTESEQQFNLKQ